MLEVERNTPIEPGVLAEFLARCGWDDSQAAAKLSWVLRGSVEWVACRLDGELIGFGRSIRSRQEGQTVLSVLVDPRYRETALAAAMVHMLTGRGAGPAIRAAFDLPHAPPDAYLGKPWLRA
jgi:hypothetical protein